MNDETKIAIFIILTTLFVFFTQRDVRKKIKEEKKRIELSDSSHSPKKKSNKPKYLYTQQ